MAVEVIYDVRSIRFCVIIMLLICDSSKVEDIDATRVFGWSDIGGGEG